MTIAGQWNSHRANVLYQQVTTREARLSEANRQYLRGRKHRRGNIGALQVTFQE